jgi:hypothetical protein
MTKQPAHPHAITARSQLIRWGALMAVIYGVYVTVFPLLPGIEEAAPVRDIEMLLRNGRKWFALVYILGLVLLFFAYWRALKLIHLLSSADPQAAKSLRNWIIGIGLMCGVILLWLYPITALDVALYVVRARIWALYGGNPMLAMPEEFPQHTYNVMAGEFVDTVSPYGPLWELIAQIPMRLGFTGMGAGILSMKVISLASYLAMSWLILKAERKGVGGETALAFFALNPLVLLEAVGNGHNDMLMMAFITLGLVLWQRDKWAWAALALTLASLIKITGLILLPLFGVAALTAVPNWRMRLKRGLGIAAIFLAVFFGFYLLLGPMPEVFDGVRQAMFDRRGFSPEYAARMLLRLLDRSAWMPQGVMRNLFILYYGCLLARLMLGRMNLLEAGFAAYFGQLMLGSTFRIWYPLWLIPFAALNLTSLTYWRTFLFSLTAELSILSYYILWRWYLRAWVADLALPSRWDYWSVMTLLTVPWTFGIPLIGPMLRRWRDKKRFDETFWA